MENAILDFPTLKLSHTATDSRDENLEAKFSGGGGRVRGGTEATTRNIFDAPAAAIQSRRFSSRCPGDESNDSPSGLR